VILLALVLLNNHFYLFLAGQRGKMFALAAIPFHLLYFISSGVAFALAMVRHRLGMVNHEPQYLPRDPNPGLRSDDGLPVRHSDLPFPRRLRIGNFNST